MGIEIRHFFIDFTVHASRASVKSVQVENSFVTVELEIEHVVAYYKKLFAKDGNLDTNFDCLENFSWSQFSLDQNLLLMATPSQEEVRLAVFGLDPASSPGPDGFGGCFYQKCWDIITDIVTNVIIQLLIFLRG